MVLSEVPQESLDAASQLLHLAARLHAARGDPAAWKAVLADCRDWFGCDGVLKMLPRDGCRHDELETLAGRLTHCANYGGGCGGAQPENQLNRQRCAALASHLHLAAITDKMALKAMVFEHLLPTWLIDQNRRVHIANSAAQALSDPGSGSPSFTAV